VSAAQRFEPAEEPPARILVVDDVPMFRELEQLFLSRIGEVRTASSAAEALSEALDFQPQVVLLDLHLPDRPGDEIADELRTASPPECAIVFVTSGLASEHARAIAAGAVDVLAKPLSRSTLVQAVSRFLGDTQPPVGLPRVKHVTPVRFHGTECERTGVIRNLSRGGLFIEAEWLPPEGTEMALSFDLPGLPEPIEPTARIVWRQMDPDLPSMGVGVRFVALDGNASRELDEFVDGRATYGATGFSPLTT
jgi:uncharacterized protein (TIGR02266 family)